MVKIRTIKDTKNNASGPGRKKIIDAFNSLLEKREFDAITTAEIARIAGVSEALIYKYFDHKRDLLYQLLREYLEQFRPQLELDLMGINGALNKIRRLFWTHIYAYSKNRVFSKLLFLEVRGFPDYYMSETYQLVKDYAKIFLNIIDEGVRSGEIRDDIPPRLIRQVLMGSIEHVCLRAIIFDQEFSPDELTENLCELLFKGIVKGKHRN
jgi:AcrR family transcriptional regulator